jgi:hypothetical protein
MLNSRRNKSLRRALAGLFPVAMAILDGKCSMVYNFTADQHVFSRCESPGESQPQFSCYKISNVVICRTKNRVTNPSGRYPVVATS